MKQLLIALMILVFGFVGITQAEEIFFEGFEDSYGFVFGGAVPLYWETAPLSGTATIPSQFEQGSSGQDGNIFYGSRAKENSSSPAATITIALPDLSGYTNLELTVALAAADGIWEPTHRDSLRIIGGTTLYPPYIECYMGYGCESVPGTIDIFLPLSYPDDLRSNVYSIALGHQFQDFNYTINSNMKLLTFAFASSAGVEVIGIDSVRITGDAITPTIEDVINFFEESVESGDLIGNGPGNSANNRLNAFGNMLYAAYNMIADEDYEAACDQLMDAYKKCDGMNNPQILLLGNPFPNWQI